MALKLKIGKSAYDALPDDVKKEYKADGSDFVLDLTDYEDPTELRRARDNANNERNDAKRDRDKFKSDLDKANTKIADLEKDGKSVDDKVNAKDAEWKKKYDEDTAARDATIKGLRDSRIGDKRTELATTLANKISTSPGLLIDHLAKRIEVEIDDATHAVKHYVLGTDGKRTASTLEDLEKESLKNKDWAPILRATKATGGGGAPPAPGGGGAPRSEQHRPGTPPEDLSKLPAAEFAARIKAEKEAQGRA